MSGLKHHGLVPQKMVKFKPGLSQFQAWFSHLRTCNSRLQNTVDPLLRDTVMITQSVTLSNVKYKNGTKFSSWINANRLFRNWAVFVCCVRCLFGQQQTSHETNLMHVQPVMRKNYCSCSSAVGSSLVKFDL